MTTGRSLEADCQSRPALRLQRRPDRSPRGSGARSIFRARGRRSAAARVTRRPDGRSIPTIFPESVDEQGAVKLLKQDVRFFMPRVGIAYRPTEKWVMRVGAGWFDNINHMNTWTIFNLMPPKSGSLLLQLGDRRGADDPGHRRRRGDLHGPDTRMYRAGQPILTLNDPFLQADRRRGTSAADQSDSHAARYQGRRRLEVELRHPARTAVPDAADRGIRRAARVPTWATASATTTRRRSVLRTRTSRRGGRSRASMILRRRNSASRRSARSAISTATVSPSTTGCR